MFCCKTLGAFSAFQWLPNLLSGLKLRLGKVWHRVAFQSYTYYPENHPVESESDRSRDNHEGQLGNCSIEDSKSQSSRDLGQVGHANLNHEELLNLSKHVKRVNERKHYGNLQNDKKLLEGRLHLKWFIIEIKCPGYESMYFRITRASQMHI